MALGLFWIGEYHKLQKQLVGFWRFEVNLLGFFFQKNSTLQLVVFFSKLGILQVRCVMLQKKTKSCTLFVD